MAISSIGARLLVVLSPLACGVWFGGCAERAPIEPPPPSTTTGEELAIAEIFVPNEEAARAARVDASKRGEPRAATARAEAPSSDEALEDAIRARLARDPAVGLEGIDVQVDDAIVTLEGKTGNLLEKEHAVIHARYQPGVRAVIDRLTVTPQRRADAEVQSDVEQALVDDPATDAFEVRSRVEEGVVTLEGSVDSETEKELAAKVSAGVGGVRRVQNELAVGTTLARTDMEISADIRGRLLADPLVDASGVTVRVTDGRAELWGRVPTAEERARVLWDAWVKGVRAVEADELVVGTECPTP